MNSSASNTRANVMPCLAYWDARGAIDWLCRTFGFEQHAAHADERGRIVHAELVLGRGMVMLGSVDRESPYGRWIAQPDEIDGRQTQTIYIVTDNPDEIHRRAQAAGVEIVMPIEDKGYGGRGFTCRDLEGHFWSFGSYDPWSTAGANVD